MKITELDWKMDDELYKAYDEKDCFQGFFCVRSWDLYYVEIEGYDEQCYPLDFKREDHLEASKAFNWVDLVNFRYEKVLPNKFMLLHQILSKAFFKNIDYMGLKNGRTCYDSENRLCNFFFRSDDFTHAKIEIDKNAHVSISTYDRTPSNDFLDKVLSISTVFHRWCLEVLNDEVNFSEDFFETHNIMAISLYYEERVKAHKFLKTKEK